MKKKLYSLILIMAFMFLPSAVNALSMSLSISCKDVALNSNTTCTVSGTASGGTVGAIEGKVAITSSGGSASFVSASLGSGWQGEIDSNSIALYGDGKTGTFTIGTFTLKGTKAGKVNFAISNVTVGDPYTYAEGTAANKTATFNVTSGAGTTTTKKTTTTTKKTTTTRKTTTKGATTTTTGRVYTTGATTTTIRSTDPTTAYDPNFSTTTSTSTTTWQGGSSNNGPEMVLYGVSVDNFTVEYEHGIYMVTVYPETETVQINANGPEGSTVTGVGSRTLAVGTNAVELTLIMGGGETKVFPLYISRPDPNKKVDTRLRSLKVVGYEIDFNADKKEYSVSIPLGVKEVYIEYETTDDDIIVTGAGKIFLSNTKNAYIKSSYGSISSTDYTITFKTNYLSVILIVIIVILTLGIGGMLAYYFMEKKKAQDAVTNASNKATADVNRANKAKGPKLSFNGKSTSGTGSRMVIPTQVASPGQPAPAQGQVQPQMASQVMPQQPVQGQMMGGMPAGQPSMQQPPMGNPMGQAPAPAGAMQPVQPMQPVANAQAPMPAPMPQAAPAQGVPAGMPMPAGVPMANAQPPTN